MSSLFSSGPDPPFPCRCLARRRCPCRHDALRTGRARGVPRDPQAHCRPTSSSTSAPTPRCDGTRWTRERYLTDQARLFVRNHTVDADDRPDTWRLRVFGDGLATPRAGADALSLSYDDLRRLPRTRSSRSTSAPATAGVLRQPAGDAGHRHRLEARRRRHRRVGGRPAARRAQEGRALADAVSIQATGLDPNYVTGGVDYGPVRRPFPVSKALDDALLAWGMNGEPLLPDHGYPVRLVLPGWVGIGSIKWLGSLEVAHTELTSPWNTKWYRMTGGDLPGRQPPLTVNPVRSAWELPLGATLAGGADGHADRPRLERRGADPPGRRQPRRRHDLAPGRARDRAGHGAGTRARRGHGWRGSAGVAPRRRAAPHGSWPGPPTRPGRSSR